jgi:hypothetical protein
MNSRTFLRPSRLLAVAVEQFYWAIGSVLSFPELLIGIGLAVVINCLILLHLLEILELIFYFFRHETGPGPGLRFPFPFPRNSRAMAKNLRQAPKGRN